MRTTLKDSVNKNFFKIRPFYCLAAAVCLVAILFTGCVFTYEYYPDSDTYHVGSGSATGTLKSLDISWTAGSVTISPYDGAEILLNATDADEDEDRMRFRLKNGVLTVYFQASGINFDPPKDKDLEILIPREQASAIQKLEIESSSAAILLNKLDIQTLNIQTASGDFTAEKCTFSSTRITSSDGNCTLSDCTVKTLNVKTASGDILIDSTIEELALSSADGDMTICNAITPNRIKAQTSDGDIEVTLPADSEFTAEYESGNNAIAIAGFRGKYQRGRFICGNSLNKYILETASGKIKLIAK